MKKDRIPFSLEKYHQGDYKLVTRNNIWVKIVHENIHSDWPIAAISLRGLKVKLWEYNLEGRIAYSASLNQTNPMDLFLEKEVFEDGDIVCCNFGNGTKSIFIFKIYDQDGSMVPYFDFECGSKLTANYTIYTSDKVRIATKEEEEELHFGLKEKGMECIEKFKPKDWCLMRHANNPWVLCQFSHVIKGTKNYYMAVGGSIFDECIKYNEETMNLLGKDEYYLKTPTADK